MAITRSQQAKQLLALGGRIGLQEGGIMPRLNQLGSGVSSAEQTLQNINQRLESAESSLGGGGVEQLQAVRPSGSGELGIFPSSRPENTMGPLAQIPASGGVKLPELQSMKIDPPTFMRPGNIPGTDVSFSTLRGGGGSLGIPAASYANGGRIGLQEGATADEGHANDPGHGSNAPGDGGGKGREDRRAGQYTSPEGKAVADRNTDKGGFSLRNFTPISVRLAKNLFDKFGPKKRDINIVDEVALTGEEDDDTPERGDEGGTRSAMRFNPMMTATSMMNPMTPQQGIGALDLNRIAYRFMADGGFLEDTDEARQAYGLGSIVKKAFKTVRKPFKAVTKTLKKVAKSPTGKLLLAVAAPYALGPAMAQASFLQGLTAAQQAALISGATTGITQLATGEDLDFKDIALSAAIGGASAKAFPAGGAKPGTQQGFSRPTMADVAGPSLPKTSPAFTRPTMADIAGPSRTRGLSGIEDYGNLIDVASPAKTSAFTRPTMADIAGPTSTSTFTRPTMADVGVTGMPSVKQSLSEKLLASSRRGLSAIKDSKLTDILLRGDDGKISPLKVALLGSGIAGLAAAKGMGQEELEEQDRGESIDFAAIRRRPFDTLAPRFAGSQFDFYAAEGGQAKKEPVAKKVMPLLDMGGMEKDYRAEGGFVPIGRMEKADDVPARLSKNEFVFTADAVRNAGDGDVDKGAEVMYNMMKNLEAGGDVSEESQGLEGARRMFQTSQRLEEVL